MVPVLEFDVQSGALHEKESVFQCSFLLIHLSNTNYSIYEKGASLRDWRFYYYYLQGSENMNKFNKVVTINGNAIPFAINSKTDEIYKSAFNHDMWDAIKTTNLDGAWLHSMLFVYPRIIWALAKTANSSLPTMETWYKQLGAINTLEICNELESLFNNFEVINYG